MVMTRRNSKAKLLEEKKEEPIETPTNTNNENVENKKSKNNSNLQVIEENDNDSDAPEEVKLVDSKELHKKRKKIEKQAKETQSAARKKHRKKLVRGKQKQNESTKAKKTLSEVEDSDVNGEAIPIEVLIQAEKEETQEKQNLLKEAKEEHTQEKKPKMLLSKPLNSKHHFSTEDDESKIVIVHKKPSLIDHGVGYTNKKILKSASFYEELYSSNRVDESKAELLISEKNIPRQSTNSFILQRKRKFHKRKRRHI